jgi:hypothetical protein
VVGLVADSGGLHARRCGAPLLAHRRPDWTHGGRSNRAHQRSPACCAGRTACARRRVASRPRHRSNDPSPRLRLPSSAAPKS